MRFTLEGQWDTVIIDKAAKSLENACAQICKERLKEDKG
jgi:hypothetical protein